MYRKPFFLWCLILGLLIHPGATLTALQHPTGEIAPTFLNKVDPVLKPLCHRDFIGALRSNGAYPFIWYPERDFRPMVKAILLMSHSPFSLRHLGVNPRSVLRSGEPPHGFILTADIPLSALADVAKMDTVLYIHAAQRGQLLAPALDKSVPTTGANQVWRSNPNYTGKDVIVGFIDTGIDWSHQDFKRPDGRSRIRFIWDQTQTTNGVSPERYGYGTEWTQGEIEAGLCTQMDYSGHGTHLASIAAGNGRGTGVQSATPRFVGMAPEADIIMVKSNLFEDEVFDATRYIFEKADQLGKPAVVNMSFAYEGGPHDGRTLLERALNELARERPGRAIVAGIGNRGESSIHAGGLLLSPRENNYPKLILRPPLNARSVFVTLWYSAKESIAVRVQGPRNVSGDPLNFEWVKKGEVFSSDVPKGPWEDALLIVDSQSPHPLYSDLASVVIFLWNGGDASMPLHRYPLTIELDGPGVAFDAYYLSNRLDGGFETRAIDPWMIRGDADKTVGMPATARDVLGVASYVTRNQWTDQFGRLVGVNSRVDEISPLSSFGPRRDDARKPDLAAPGEIIIAALSERSWGYPPLVAQDRSHKGAGGSSLAAAHATGAVALLFQQDAARTVDEVKRLLVESAVDRGDAGWDARWGAGQINLLNALNIPSIPEGFSAEVSSGGTVELKWQPNPEPNIAGYKLHLSDQVLDVGAVQTFRLTELENDVQHSLALTAYNTAGHESAKTRTLIVTPTQAGVDRTPPTAPVGLIATAGDRRVDLQWTANPEPDVAGYFIYLGFASGDYQDIYNVGRQTEVQLGGFDNDVSVYLAVSAYDRSGNESEKSDEVVSTPKPLPFTEIPQQQGWPFQTNSEVYSSPVPFDLDGDGDLEILLATREGVLHAWHHDGTSVGGWPVRVGGVGDVVATPAVGDLDADGTAEVVLPAERRVYIFRADGTPFSDKWPLKLESPIVATPVLADLDNDFDQEMILTTKKDGVHVLHHDGSPMEGWPQAMDGWGFASAAVGDLDQDKSLEIIVTTSEPGVYAWRASGKRVSGWPIVPNPSSGANAPPVLGDLDGDGFLEVVIMYRSGSVYVLNRRGEFLNGWPVQMGFTPYAAPAIGDVDGDGDLEIVIGDLENETVSVLNHDGTPLEGWPLSIFGSTVTSAPVLGDIDSDGDVEVLIAANWGSFFGQIHAFDADGTELQGWPVMTTGNLQSSPALSDLDGDGDIELCIGSLRARDGDAIINGSVYVWDLDGTYDPAHIEWGMLGANPAHTGIYIKNLSQPSTLTEFAGTRVFNQIRLSWTTNGEYGNLGWHLYRSESLDGEFHPLERERSSTTGFAVEGLEPVFVKGKGYSEIQRNYIFFDSTASPFKTYSYFLENRGLLGRRQRSDIIEVERLQPVTFGGIKTGLHQNFPNPGNPETWMPFTLGETAEVVISIHTPSGELVRKLNLGRKPAGLYLTKPKAAYWNGQNEAGEKVASGVYFYTLTTETRPASRSTETRSKSLTKRLVILK